METEFEAVRSANSFVETLCARISGTRKTVKEVRSLLDSVFGELGNATHSVTQGDGSDFDKGIQAARESIASAKVLLEQMQVACDELRRPT